YGSPKNVTFRDGRLQLDNGYCRVTETVEYFGDSGPSHTANCLPNEVEVPNVVGQPVGRARSVLAAQPLAATVVYKPAEPRQRVGPGGSGPRATKDLASLAPGLEPERRAIERQAVLRARDFERLAEPTGACAQEPLVVEPTPRSHCLDPRGRLEGADQHRV